MSMFKTCDECKYCNNAEDEFPCLHCGNKVDYWEQQSKPTVDHPTHYNREGAMECIDEMRLIFGDEETAVFCKLNAWKYRYRAADKNGAEDLKKSDWYIRKYKELMNEAD